jgi:hypothetical protein
MKNTIQFKWFIESLTDQQKKDYNEESINNQKDWYISYLENHYTSKNEVNIIIDTIKRLRVDGNDICTRSGNLMLDNILSITNKYSKGV